MADQYAVTYRGTTLLSASDGEFKFRRGLKPRKIAVSDTLSGAAIKVGCQGSATHVLTLEIITDSASASSIHNQVYGRIQNLWDGRAGALSVPGFLTINNAVIENVDTSEQDWAARANGQTIVEGASITVTITFIEA